MTQSKTIFFVHQNMPAQFRNLAPALARDGHRVFFITNGRNEVAGLNKVHYQIDPNLVHPQDTQFMYAQRAARAMVYLKEHQNNTVPDLVIGHVAWGEMMYVRDIYPKVPIIGYFEWFHREQQFARYPEHVSDANAPFVLRIKNIPTYVSADICDTGITPTWWQHSTFPKGFQDKLNVIHDGVDTIGIRRPASASLTLPDGRVLTSDDEVVTYVARGLEPVRGFSTMIRAAAKLCRARPRAHVVIVGGEDTAYGNPAADGRTYKERMLAEVPIDTARVHFLGRVSYKTFLDVLYVSSAHVYLTFPFVLSWSMLEAMAAECLVIGSRTAPVEEVVVDGHNGLLVPFHDHEALAERLAEALERPRDFDPLRREARRTILERYDLHGICLPRQKALIASLL